MLPIPDLGDGVISARAEDRSRQVLDSGVSISIVPVRQARLVRGPSATAVLVRASALYLESRFAVLLYRFPCFIVQPASESAHRR